MTRRPRPEAEVAGGAGARAAVLGWRWGGEEAKKSAAASNRLLRRSIELRRRRIELPVTSSPSTTPAPPPRRAGRGFISLPRPRTTLACPSPPPLPQLRLPCSRTRTRARVCRGRASRLPWCARSAASGTRTASGTSCPRDSERRAGEGGAAEASGAAGGAAVAAARGASGRGGGGGMICLSNGYCCWRTPNIHLPSATVHARQSAICLFKIAILFVHIKNKAYMMLNYFYT